MDNITTLTLALLFGECAAFLYRDLYELQRQKTRATVAMERVMWGSTERVVATIRRKL